MSERRSFSNRSSGSRSQSRHRSRSRNRRPSFTRSGSSQSSIRRSLINSNELDNFKLSPYHFSSHPQFHSSEEESKSNEVPTINVSIDHTLPQEYFKTDLLNTIKALRISKWHRLPITVANDIQLKRISGALTNTIFKIDAPSVIILKNHNLHNIIFPSILLRIYGPSTDSIIDRDYELKILTKLSKKNIGPKLLGIFKNGRLEQFLENAITLTKKDIMNLKTSARIARRMKELHVGIPVSSKEKDLGPAAIKNIKDWFNTIESWYLNDNFNYKSVNEIQLFKMSFLKYKESSFKYLNWIEKKYNSSSFKDLKFCHNDTQYGNLLFSTSIRKSDELNSKDLVSNLSNLSLEDLPHLNPSIQEKKQDQNLVVIDFEYSGPNFPGYDIANHFSEWMHNYAHPTKSYSLDINDFPSIEQQLNFNYSYVLFRNPEFPDISKVNSENLKLLETQSKLIYNQVLDWRPAVSIFWSLWAILQNGPLDKSDKNEEIFENGVNGETYKIIEEENDDDYYEIDEGVEGTADNENFEYLLYAMEKIEVLFGDLIQLGLVSKNDIDESEINNIKYLNCQYFDIE